MERGANKTIAKNNLLGAKKTQNPIRNKKGIALARYDCR
jgi:hypothetical protein